MCGVSGSAVRQQRGARVDVALVKRMSATLTHRGPDDAGLFVDTNVALANRRLSIVDLPGGHQPMTSEDGRVTVTYNGEIYNAPEIRRRHERQGRRYRTSCDTEVLIHLYAEEGRDLVQHLRGCFAFALWDRDTQELLLARDRLGVKPLYFVHKTDGSITFASEIKALIASQACKAELNLSALPGYLANRSTYGEATLFAGVRRLLPGCTLVWRDGQIQRREYWDLAPALAEPGDEAGHVREWDRLFRESVHLRLMGDVPIGVLLSGGIDSAAIAAVMSDLSGESVKTFSVGFPDSAVDELPAARAVATKLRTEHKEIVVTPEQFFGALPHLTWHSDEPLSHPAAVPLYFVSRLAAQDVKAVLCGEGADETLAGYARYRTTLYNIAAGHLYERFVPDGIRRSVALRARGRRASRTFLARPADERSLFLDNFAVFDSRAQNSLFAHEAATGTAGIDPHDDAWRHLNAQPQADRLSRMLYADSKTYLHGLLMKQDKMTMAASLESRVPFLDHVLVEATARLPSSMKLRRWWTTKLVLRRSMDGVLPRDVLTRPKRGFPVPIDTWFRGQLEPVVAEYVLGERARRRGLFDREFVSRLVNEHSAGARHTERLWTLVSFEFWARCFLDGEWNDLNEPSTGACGR